MKGYFIFDNLKVHDVSKLEAYKKEAGPLVEKYGGKYIVLGGPFEVVEGSWNPTFLVMIEFPTYDIAREWYTSKEYEELKALRLSAVDSNGVVVKGF